MFVFLLPYIDTLRNNNLCQFPSHRAIETDKRTLMSMGLSGNPTKNEKTIVNTGKCATQFKGFVLLVLL